MAGHDCAERCEEWMILVLLVNSPVTGREKRKLYVRRDALERHRRVSTVSNSHLACSEQTA